jgi:hypothetical protein
MFDRYTQYYSRADQHRALALLHDPSSYPALPDLSRANLLLQLCTAPSFEPMMSWTIYRLRDDTYRLRRVRWDFITDIRIELGEPTTYASDAFLDSEFVQHGLAELSAISLPAFALSDTIGTDGVTFGLRRETVGHFVEICWWCEPPAGCERIGEWYHRFIDSLEARLPAHTDHLRHDSVRP